MSASLVVYLYVTNKCNQITEKQTGFLTIMMPPVLIKKITNESTITPNHSLHISTEYKEKGKKKTTKQNEIINFDADENQSVKLNISAPTQSLNFQLVFNDKIMHSELIRADDLIWLLYKPYK